MSTSTHKYGKGTSVTQSYPWGIYVRAQVLCSDGKVRATSRIADTAETFFSVPASVKVNGTTVAGYLTIEDNVALFVAYTYRKNGAMLPEGKARI
jgi:hypothetical protein